MRFVALLRGINVSGQKSIKMADLKNMFEASGFQNVRTYVQSGNVVFDYMDIEISELCKVVESLIKDTFGFDVSVIILESNELDAIVNNNPFIKEPEIEHDKLHITFLSELPDDLAVLKLEVKKEDNEKFLIDKKAIYLYCPNGYGRTKLTNTVFERKLKTTATTRNIKTVNCLLDMAKQDL